MSFSFSKFSIESLSIPSKILILSLIVVTLVLFYYLFQSWWMQQRDARKIFKNILPNSVLVRGRPLIRESEVALFNLLHLVSRDNFFVFAKISFRTLFRLGSDNKNIRREVAKAIRNFTADFVLVHPGTMLPCRILMIESKHHGGAQPNSLSNLMQEICREAGIDIIWLESNKSYGAKELSELLGLRQEED